MAYATLLAVPIASGSQQVTMVDGIGAFVHAERFIRRYRRDDRIPHSGLRLLANATLRFTLEESTVWAGHLAGARSYLEWGSGGSTVLASWLSLQRAGNAAAQRDGPLMLHSIEHSEGWVETLRDQNPLAVRRAEAAGLLHFHLPFIGPTGDWGRPTNWGGRDLQLRMRQARSYVEPKGVSCCFDMILIDGRFREACALQALRLSHSSSVVLMHDYESPESLPQHRREYNRTVRRWFDIVQQQDSLIVLRAKPNAFRMLSTPAFQSELEQRERDDFMR